MITVKVNSSLEGRNVCIQAVDLAALDICQQCDMSKTFSCV